MRLSCNICPDESGKIWFNFVSGEGAVTSHGFGLQPGHYKIATDCVARYEAAFDWIINIWAGRPVQTDEWAFEVAEKGAAQEPLPIVRVVSDVGGQSKMNRWLHTFEEFQTSFETHLAGIPKDGVEGTFYLQVAPWNRDVPLKLIAGDIASLRTVRVPISAESDSLKINFKPTDRNLTWNGKEWTPIVATQTMSDMRANIQMGPKVEPTIRQDLAAMKDHGITLVTTTAMPWLYDFIGRPYIQAQPTPNTNPNGDALKCYLDLARIDGPRIEAWSDYP